MHGGTPSRTRALTVSPCSMHANTQINIIVHCCSLLHFDCFGCVSVCVCMCVCVGLGRYGRTACRCDFGQSFSSPARVQLVFSMSGWRRIGCTAKVHLMYTNDYGMVNSLVATMTESATDSHICVVHTPISAVHKIARSQRREL